MNLPEKNSEMPVSLVINRQQAERLYWAIGHEADGYTEPIFSALREYIGKDRALEISMKGRRAFETHDAHDPEATANGFA